VNDARGQLRIRDAGEHDLGAVHAINESEVPHVNSISVDRFRRFIDEAVYFKIAEIETGSRDISSPSIRPPPTRA